MTTGVQIGYTFADIISMVGLGILVYNIAVRKSAAERDEAFAGRPVAA